MFVGRSSGLKSKWVSVISSAVVIWLVTPRVNCVPNKFECWLLSALWRPFEYGALALLIGHPRREAYHLKLQRAMTGKAPPRTFANSVGRGESMNLFAAPFHCLCACLDQHNWDKELVVFLAAHNAKYIEWWTTAIRLDGSGVLCIANCPWLPADKQRHTDTASRSGGGKASMDMEDLGR
jgi:hypothetical protein